LYDQGWFAGQRVELIEGRVIQMPPQKPPHTIGVELGREALEAAVGRRYWVRCQAPLHLGGRSAPEPDLAIVPGRPRDYIGKGHPISALLVVEVSGATLAYDRGLKAGIYARYGITDYWIVNLVHRRLEVLRQPVPGKKPRSFRYADVTLLGATDHVSPLALPRVKIFVSDLLP
jgi:Uma2 family endonuclease